MSTEYDFSLSGDAARALLGASRNRRRRAETVLDALAKDPFHDPDFEEVGPAGRGYSVIVRHDVILTYWVDHGGKEVRVIRVEFV